MLALAEDGDDDITSRISVVETQQGTARIEARSALVMAGLAYADAVVSAVGLAPIRWRVRQGTVVDRPMVIGEVSGSLRAMLRAERPLLNMLQRAAGIATLTHRATAAVAGTGCRILHTRKTTPGLRHFEVAAVEAGGGMRHRVDLSDTVMIKDNHWQAMAANGLSLATALQQARDRGVTGLYVEVESAEQLDQAVHAGATRLLIDNQSAQVVADWGRRARDRAPGIEIEATGGITLADLADYAAAGADYISLGLLTHSVPSADLGLELAV